MKPRGAGEPQNCLNANLRKASRAITKFYVGELADTGLLGTQFTLLATIDGYAECTITGLADYLVMDQTTVTRSIDKLRAQGLVEVVVGADRRERILYLTEQGAAVLEEALPKWRVTQTQVWEKLGEAKARLLLDLLDEVVELAG